MKLFSYSLISALLLSAGWPVFGFSPLLFIGFLPLLFVEQRMLRDNSRHAFLYLFLYTYLCFIIWNLSVSWWICLASPGGAVAAILENALVMALVFTTAHVTKKMLLRIFKNNLVQRLLHYNLVFIIFWLAFEYLNHNWDLAYPWLTLGNGLAGNHRFIQWYEYTGVLGGSLWILSVNVLLYNYLSDREFQYKFKSKRGIAIILLVFVPALISLFMYSSQPGKQSGLHSKIMVVQPNIDPYHEKFDGSFDLQLKKMLELASTKLDTSFNYLVFPETALTENIWENELDQSESLQTIQVFLKKYPRLIIVTGANTSRFYKPEENPSETAQKMEHSDAYYDNYNTALQLDNTGKIQVYHKSKLVPGVEKMPFPVLLKPLESLAINLGGTIGSLGTQQQRTPFVSPAHLKVAPIICYESVFGEHVSEFVKNGAGLLFIITNDGWWGDTPGYKQHLIYGRLRAIENRRCVVRSANTGISCFINEKGDIEDATGWWQPAVIMKTLPIHEQLTFYTRHGDYIGRISAYGTLFLILSVLLGRFSAIVFAFCSKKTR